MLKKNDPNRKNRRKNKKGQKIKPEIKTCKPRFIFSPEIKEIFEEGLRRIIEKNKEQENK